MVRISEKSLYIIKRLMENARIPLTRLAKELGITEAAVRKRIKKLEDEGIIKGYTVLVDPKKMGYNVLAFIGFDTKPEAYVSVVEKVKHLPQVKKFYATTGDHMFMVLGWFRDREEMEAFIKQLERIEGVERVCPAVVVEEIK